MKDDDSSSCRRRVRSQATVVSPPAAVSLSDEIDWDKVRTTAYKITAQVKAVNEVEQAVRKHLHGSCGTEWQGGRNCQELALGITQRAAGEWLIAHLEWQELQAYMYALTRRVGSTDEITQSVRDKLLRMTASTWEKVEDRKKYIDSVVYNTAIDWMRREESQQYAAARKLQHILVGDYDPGDVATRACAPRDVTTLLRRLGPRVRQAFVLRQAWGYTVKEIAARMSIAEETVKTYLAQAAEVFSDLTEPGPCRSPGKRLSSWFMRKEEES